MAFVFQYGSNMSVARLNHSTRLLGDAVPIGLAATIDTFDLEFTVWSKSNNCAAADIVPNDNGRIIMGVCYEIPDYLITRDTANAQGRKSLDAIEGEGTNYFRTDIQVALIDGTQRNVVTYVVKNRRSGLKTDIAYAAHILDGLREHTFDQNYKNYVVSQIVLNNPNLKEDVLTYMQ